MKAKISTLILLAISMASVVWAGPIARPTPTPVDCSPLHIAQLKDQLRVDENIRLELLREANNLAQLYAGQRMPGYVLDRWIALTHQALLVSQDQDRIRAELALCP